MLQSQRASVPVWAVRLAALASGEQRMHASLRPCCKTRRCIEITHEKKGSWKPRSSRKQEQNRRSTDAHVLRELGFAEIAAPHVRARLKRAPRDTCCTDMRSRALGQAAPGNRPRARPQFTMPCATVTCLSPSMAQPSYGAVLTNDWCHVVAPTSLGAKLAGAKEPSRQRRRPRRCCRTAHRHTSKHGSEGSTQTAQHAACCCTSKLVGCRQLRRGLSQWRQGAWRCTLIETSHVLRARKGHTDTSMCPELHAQVAAKAARARLPATRVAACSRRLINTLNGTSPCPC